MNITMATSSPMSLIKVPEKCLGYIVNSANGKLTPIAGSPFSTGKSGSTSVAVDPAGRFLYATNQFAGDNDISGFQY